MMGHYLLQANLGQYIKGGGMKNLISLIVTGICVLGWHYIGFVDVNSMQPVDNVIYFMVVFLYFKEIIKGD